MKKMVPVLAVVLLALSFGLVQAKGYEMTKKAGDLSVVVKIDRNPPAMGINKMEVAIKDSAGKDVTDARVLVEYGMPAMPGMGAMNYRTNTVLKNNNYQASINFSMSGPWYINIKINRGSKAQTVKLNVDIK